MEKQLAIIIPAHNEEKRIEKTLRGYLSYFNNIEKSKKLNYKLIVVINASKDKTRDIVEEMRKKDKHLEYLDLASYYSPVGGEPLAPPNPQRHVPLISTCFGSHKINGLLRFILAV